MRLAHRLLFHDPVPPHESTLGVPIDYDGFYKRTKSQAELIAKITNVSLDNVADFYALHDQQEWDLTTDFPNWAPPFQSFFAEWNEPEKWNLGDGIKTHQRNTDKMGALCIYCNVTDENRSNRILWTRLICGLMGMNPNVVVKPDESLDRQLDYLDKSKWVLFCDCFASSNIKPVCGRPVLLGLQYILFIDEAGRVIANCTTGISCKWMSQLDGGKAPWHIAHIIGLGISFMHCKNVARVEHHENRGDKWHKHTRIPVIRYYTLNIEPMKKILRVEGNSEVTGIKKALHICRGHFATYDESKPLFGKYSGTFFRPDHVRGSREQGQIIKDYAVKCSSTPS